VHKITGQAKHLPYNKRIYKMLVTLNKVYHVYNKKQLRAIIDINNCRCIVKCNDKENSLISGNGYSLEVVGLNIDDQSMEFIAHDNNKYKVYARK